MSRNIPDKNSVSISPEESSLRDTAAGKLLFTCYHDKQCIMLLDDGRLKTVSFPEEANSKIGAIYIGKVKNISQNINAAFVEIADSEICFLPLKDATAPFLLNRSFDGRILAGDEILVQIVRDAQKTKQASVTARISLSNDYFALELGFDRILYSSRLDKAKRTHIANLLQDCGIEEKATYLNQNALRNREEHKTTNEAFSGNINVPPIGIIVRTKAGEFTDASELSSKFHALSDIFIDLLHKALYRKCFSLLKEAPEPFEYVFNHLIYTNEYNEIVTDNPETYSKLIKYTREHMPDKKVRLYTDNTLSLQNLYSIPTKMEMALNERVWLKSGGYLVVQPTEALTVIDVNSGKYEARKGFEETALKINLEAAEEIALQLRLRNLSGIIIVDFINMKEDDSREKLLAFLKSAVIKDRLQTEVVDMTPLGLVELTRKKESKPLYEQVKGVR